VADGIKAEIDTRGLKRKLDRIEKNQVGAMGRVLLVAAHDVRTEAARSLVGGSKSGVIRKVTKAGKTHQASAPGEAPASDTGSLLRSLFAELRQGGKRPEAIVGTDIAYGPWLEFGTKNMEARPWLEPAFKRRLATIKRLIDDAFRKANRGA